MNPGSYALRFRGVDKKYLEQLGDAHFEERADLLARSRRLSADTAKRRKAIALKRKLEAQKEEKRRQEILQRRREQIREATEKYQRGNKNYSAKDHEMYDRYKVPTLEEALSAVGGKSVGRVSSASRASCRSYSAAMATGGVAQVRASSAHITRTTPGSGTNKPHVAHYNYTGSKTVGQNQSQTQLHDHSLHNLNNSRSLFEKQLHHHQQMLVEQQKQSLHQFNVAIQQEMEQDPKLQGVEQTDDISIRTDSPDSVDSLEVNESQNIQPVNGAASDISETVVKKTINVSQSNGVQKMHDNKVGQGLACVNPSIILHNTRSSQSPVAVVQPQVHNQVDKHTECLNVEKHADISRKGEPERNHSETMNIIHANGSGTHNGHYHQTALVGCTIEEHGKDVSTDLKEDILVYNHADPEVVKVKAWVSSSPATEQDTNSTERRAEVHGINSKLQDQLHHQSVHNTSEMAHNIARAIPVQETITPVPVTTTVPIQPRVVPSCTTNPTLYFTTARQSASGARPVTSVVISTVGVNTQQQSSSNANTMVTPAMETLKQYSQYPMYRVATALDVEEKNSQASDTSTLTSESDVAEESQPEPEVPQVRSILKKVSSYGPPITKCNSNLSIGRAHVLTRSMSAHTGLRDSLEITKLKKEPSVKRPKSVRFADIVYNEDSDGEDRQFENKPSALSQKPPAPSTTQRNPAGKSPTKLPRASSAGTESRKPFLHPHPPKYPPTGRAVIPRNNQKRLANCTDKRTDDDKNKVNINVSSNKTQDHVIMATDTKCENSKPQAVYDPSGMRLDRTPTDEEINYLWDKVRTCLSHQSNSSITDAVQSRNISVPVTQAPTVSQKHIDGSSLAPQFRVATRVNSTYTNNYMGTATVMNTQARKKISMEMLNSFTRRQSLLNQRNKQNAIPKSSNVMSAVPVSMTTHLINPTFDCQPVEDNMVPSVGTLPNQTCNQPVSESLAAFIAAENLAKESVSDSQIEAAMDHAMKEQQALNSMHSQPRAPTALSIEEQRLMQSLERLNERLRLNETQMYPISFAPNPPYHAGFKGHQPITSSSTSKRQVNSNGTVPRHTHRSRSAPAQRLTNYAGPYRYR